MGGAKIMVNKRGAGTITGVIISLIVVMALFYGGFNYISFNYENANITDELGYDESFDKLEEAQAALESNKDDIQDSLQGIGEADGNIVSVAWNGLTGLAATLRLFINIVDVGISVWDALVPGLDFLPNWIKILVELAMIITIILIIIGAFKGEAKT